MKRIQKDELYQHLNDFLKSKGVELKEGSYTQKIQKGCALLSDAVNLGQKGFARAKAGIDSKLEQMRQVIHEKTAPRPSANSPKASEPAARSEVLSRPGSAKKPVSARKRKAPQRRQPRS